MQAQERAAAEDKRMNEAERAELDLEGSGGELLDPQQLGFHEPERDAAGVSGETAGVSDGAGDRGDNARERGVDASREEADIRPATEDATDASEENYTNIGGEAEGEGLDSARGERERLGEQLRQRGDEERGSKPEDAFASEERDVVQMGRRDEGDLSMGGGGRSRGFDLNNSKQRNHAVSHRAGDSVGEGGIPDTVVLGGRSRDKPAGAEVNPVQLADEAPRLVGYRRAKDEATRESNDENFGDLEEGDKDVQEGGRKDLEEGDDKDVGEGDEMMAPLDEDDARPT